MKKMAFFLALFVGLNAGAVARKPDEEDGQAIIVKDTARHSTAAWIQRIAESLKACYYGITKDGFIHELSWDFIHKLQKGKLNPDQNSDLKPESYNMQKSNSKGKLIWINYLHEVKNDKENLKFEFFVKSNREWER